MLELRSHRHSSELLIVMGFRFGRYDVADRFKQTSAIEPAHPFKCRQFDRLHIAPRATAVNDFCLVQAVDRFSE